jgi:hypothetical protein
MRTLFAVLMACGLLVSFMGCCLHDTCDCCSDICGGCCTNGGYYTGPTAAPAPKAEEIKKLPLPKDAAPKTDKE